MYEWMTVPKWTTKHGYFLQMGGFKLACSQDEAYTEGSLLRNWRALERKYAYRSRIGDGIWEGVMQFETFWWLLRQDLIDFPSTTEVEIDDRSKGDLKRNRPSPNHMVHHPAHRPSRSGPHYHRIGTDNCGACGLEQRDVCVLVEQATRCPMSDRHPHKGCREDAGGETGGRT